MPPGSTMPSLVSGLTLPPGYQYHTPVSGDTRRLLDPRINPATPSPSQLAPLPSYQPTTTPSGTSTAPPRGSGALLAPAQQHQPQWSTSPSTNPLPPPTPPSPYPPSANPSSANPMSAPANPPNSAPVNIPQGASPGNNQPIYVPQGSSRISIPAEPVLIEQSLNPQSSHASAGKPRVLK